MTAMKKIRTKTDHRMMQFLLDEQIKQAESAVVAASMEWTQQHRNSHAGEVGPSMYYVHVMRVCDNLARLQGAMRELNQLAKAG